MKNWHCFYRQTVDESKVNMPMWLFRLLEILCLIPAVLMFGGIIALAKAVKGAENDVNSMYGRRGKGKLDASELRANRL